MKFTSCRHGQRFRAVWRPEGIAATGRSCSRGCATGGSAWAAMASYCCCRRRRRNFRMRNVQPDGSSRGVRQRPAVLCRYRGQPPGGPTPDEASLLRLRLYQTAVPRDRGCGSRWTWGGQGSGPGTCRGCHRETGAVMDHPVLSRARKLRLTFVSRATPMRCIFWPMSATSKLCDIGRGWRIMPFSPAG